MSNDGASLIELNGTRLFLGALYLSETRFSYLSGFVGELWDELTESASLAEVSRLLDVTAADLSRSAIDRGPEGALAKLRLRDLRSIAATLEQQKERLLLVATPEGIASALEGTADKATRALKQAGIDVEIPAVHVVEGMPPPYDNRDVAALAIDSADEREYGIAEGVYFRRSSLRPYYSEFLYCHELFHVILGRSSPDLVAHGIEEGLADLLGSLWLGSETLGTPLTRRLYVLNRLSNHYIPFWERYLDATRLCYSIMLAGGGLSALLELLLQGRAGLYAVESDRGRFAARVGTARSHVLDRNPELDDLCDELLLRYPRAAVCSAHALLFAESSESGLSIAEIGTKAGLDLPTARSAAMELRDDHGLLFLRRDEVVVLEGAAAAIFGEHIFRYDTSQ